MPSTPDSRAGWASYARALTIRDHAFIDGAFQPAADADTFPSINPADGTVIADVAACGPDDVDLAVAPAPAADPRSRHLHRRKLGLQRLIPIRLPEVTTACPSTPSTVSPAARSS